MFKGICLLFIVMCGLNILWIKATYLRTYLFKIRRGNSEKVSHKVCDDFEIDL